MTPVLVLLLALFAIGMFSTAATGRYRGTLAVLIAWIGVLAGFGVMALRLGNVAVAVPNLFWAAVNTAITVWIWRRYLRPGAARIEASE